jgi:hypothetical protein
VEKEGTAATRALLRKLTEKYEISPEALIQYHKAEQRWLISRALR